ncbi:hypothetical protein HPP92_003730 [Vanilla planifolia]|uniref:PRA1 family protein n=1 Tax=Vanilla planifolia TaxID=51239 RepID=A0A835RVN5_VANPL|nr:hypothetical protein HPP92_003730 [Vanilla planifolia]
MSSFVANPLALSVPEPAFEAWLRDSGYLEILDARSSTSSAANAAGAAAFPPASSSTSKLALENPTAAASSAISSSFSFLRTLASLFTINPLAKLSADDFAGETPSWTLVFLGSAGCYSWPSGPSQARMRVQENVRRYARNYSVLSLIFFACSLYHMPVPLLGLISSLGLWELLRFYNDKCELEEKCPTVRIVLVRVVQFAILTILYLSNLQVTIFCTMSISYTVMILHAFLRKLAPSQHFHSTKRNGRTQLKKAHLSAKKSP